MTVCLNYDIEMLRNLKALYKYTDRFLTIERENETDRERERERERDEQRERWGHRDRDRLADRQQRTPSAR